jgi:hypothetical protein
MPFLNVDCSLLWYFKLPNIKRIQGMSGADLGVLKKGGYFDFQKREIIVLKIRSFYPF